MSPSLSLSQSGAQGQTIKVKLAEALAPRLNKQKNMCYHCITCYNCFCRERASVLKYFFLIYMKFFVNVVSDALCEHQNSGRESQHYSQQEGEEGNFLSLVLFGSFFCFLILAAAEL